MRAQLYQTTPTVATASTMSLSPSFPLVVSSFNYEGDDEAEEQFEFSIGEELLLDPNDIVIGELIGEGGYSMVFKGLFKNQVPVAVKVLQPSQTSAASKHQKEKFQNEVLLLSKINTNNNIVEFYGACIEPSLMIVTELLEGGTLQRLLWDCRPTPLNLKMSLNFALDISRAMEYVHSNGIIHRDLKPSDLAHAKLADFGVAREETADTMTCEAGTYRWMAPEAFSREARQGEKKHYDHKIDVYSFAIVLWELLTNRQPFSGIPNILVPYFISKNNERPSLRGIPNEAVPILESCWAEDPEARPEFEEITVLLTNLLTTLCSEGSIAATTLSDEANLDEIDEEQTTVVLHEECSCDPVRRPEEKKKMKKKIMKKVANMIRPIFKMFKGCLSKP
ncbi:unnamed protein product [Microthlaspi erraticum]|uniref:Protein kinase domain-containing protein n=1 Tax=Microthlaspi erraticum TaxID=1685480 RepID=A0A6D2HT33_9BRAS|nr:unnamed protein product [Microthlaspi erraticum]